MARSKKISRRAVSGQYIIGRERFDKISAVEGIKPSAQMKECEAEHDRKGLSAEQRRQSIIDAHRKG
jgi:hypothetical protein